MNKTESEAGRILGFRRCVICGIRLYSVEIPRCEWCEDPKVHEILSTLLEHVAEFLKANEPSSPRADHAMSFIADVGGLASKHPYLSWLRKVITMLLERGVVKRMSMAEKIWGINLLVRVKRVLPLFKKISLCGFHVTSDNEIEIEWPVGSIIRRAHSWLQTEPGRNETASFLLGYVLLNAMGETMEFLNTTNALAFDQGVACLYPVEYDDSGMPRGLRMPKGITSIISFVLGSWARGWTEFDEFTLHKFLDARGVSGKEFNAAVGLLSQTVPGVSHSILEYETYSYGGVPIKRFRYSEEVLVLRKYLRQRVEEQMR